MSNKYEHLTYNEIRDEIEGLKNELERREAYFKEMKWPTVLYKRFLIAGYTEKDLSTPEKENEILKKVVELIDEESVPWEPKKIRVIRPKYRHPKTKDEWAGRGAFPPRWVIKVMSERNWTIEQFKSSDEFKINTKRRDK